MIVSVLISKYTIEGYRKKIRVRYRISMIFSILLMFVILLISWLFWGNISIFINPSYYVFICVIILLITQVEKNQAQRRKKRKIIEVENNEIN
ncbi:MAG: hypothetical protein GY870_21145 [archaeon]|nr:hypothetical protein [archaeon]